MHGAGEYGAQCSLVEGGLMFLGIIGHHKGYPEAATIAACRRFAAELKTSPPSSAAI